MRNAPTHRRAGSLRRRKDLLFCLVLLLPAIVLCTAFILFPIVDSVGISFTGY